MLLGESAHTISLFGDQISLLTIPLVAVLALDASTAQMGYLTAAGWLPHLLFSLHAGAWVDRRGRRRVTMIGADFARARDRRRSPRRALPPAGAASEAARAAELDEPTRAQSTV